MTVDIRINNAEGALERVLGRLRQRGFALTSMNVDLCADCSTYLVQATINSTRSMDQAAKQLSKLFDVQSVNFHHHHMEVLQGNGYVQREDVRVCASV
jgi:acetolactate synthase regulatory subunit